MSEVVDLLRWRSDTSILVRAQSEFVSYQARALSIRMAQLEELDRALAQHITDLLTINTATSAFRVLLAPEVTARLRLKLPQAIRALGALLASGLEAEAAATGVAPTLSEPSWTVLGDRLVRPSGEVVTPAMVEGYPPIDVSSPQARSIDPVTALCGPAMRRSPLDDEERQRVVDLLAEVQGRIANAASSLANTLIRGCGVGLVIVKEPGTRLGSSTHGLHVGRITLASEDWQRIGAADVADALVHEAIHCLLLMLDYNQPLLVNDCAADHLPPVESPWTGKWLPVPTYLHACFVWFGLAHFWRDALHSGAFAAEESEALYARACQGFRRGSVLRRLDEDALALTSPGAQSAIALMQETMTTLVN